MAIAEELQIIVDAKVSAAIRDLNRVDRTISGTEKTTGKLSDTFKALAGPVAIGAVIAGLAKMGKELINAASDAEETGDKFDVVFARVADEAEAAAERIKSEFRLSDETVEKFLSGVGDITTGLGATGEEAIAVAEQITKLGLDISSLSNLDAEQSVKALTSLFTGEREAAKALGIVINDTNLKAYAEDMGKVFKEMTPLEKGFLSLELATKQSELAIGNAALTAGSYANTLKFAKEATKDLSAALGVSLLPAATKGVSIFAEYAAKVAEVVKEHNELQEIVRRFDEEQQTAQDRADTAQKQLAITRDLYKEQLGIIEEFSGAHEDTRAELQAEADAIRDQIRQQSDMVAYFSKIANEEKKRADAIAATAAEAQRLADLQKSASEELDGLRKENLTTEEKELENLQKKIDYWAQFRDIVGVQEVLNELISDRTVLLKEQALAEEAAAKAASEAATEHKQTHEEMFNEAMEQLSDYADYTEEITEVAEIAWDSLAQSILGSMSGLFSSLAQLQRQNTENQIAELDAQLEATLAAAGLSEETTQNKLDNQLAAAIAEGDAEKIAAAQQAADRNVIAEDFERKKAQAEYRGALSSWKLSKAIAIATGAQAIIGGFASKPFLPVGIAMGALATVETGIQIAAINGSRPTPAFAQGGSFLTNGTQNIQVGDNMGGVERVTVEPVSSAGANEGFGGGNQTIYLVVDGKQFTAHFQKQINNRALRSSIGGAL